MKRSKINTSTETGFTIVEIMIATTVLSVILLLVTTMMIGIGKLYSKGINQNRIQDNVRTINDELSQHLQLTGSDPMSATSPGGNIKAYCIGNTRYSYILGMRPGTDDTLNGFSKHVLWRDDNPNPGGCDVPDDFLSTELPRNASIAMAPRQPSKNGVELMAANSRLTVFNISPLTSPYTVSVGEVYGDNDLFSGGGLSTVCNGGSGDQFCSTSQIQSTVAKRIN